MLLWSSFQCWLREWEAGINVGKSFPLTWLAGLHLFTCCSEASRYSEVISVFLLQTPVKKMICGVTLYVLAESEHFLLRIWRWVVLLKEREFSLCVSGFVETQLCQLFKRSLPFYFCPFFLSRMLDSVFQYMNSWDSVVGSCQALMWDWHVSLWGLWKEGLPFPALCSTFS